MDNIITFAQENFLSALSIVAIFALALTLAFFGGRSIKLSKLKLPFIEFDAIDKERPDRFRFLTMAITPGAPYEYGVFNAVSQTDDRNILIHIGWHIISDTYIGRYLEYPDDQSLRKQISDLGSQNAEFIAIFRETYERNILGGGVTKVKPDYALAYLSRALSVADRIGGIPIGGRPHADRLKTLMLSFDLFGPDKFPDFEKIMYDSSENDEVLRL